MLVHNMAMCDAVSAVGMVGLCVRVDEWGLGHNGHAGPMVGHIGGAALMFHTILICIVHSIVLHAHPFYPAFGGGATEVRTITWSSAGSYRPTLPPIRPPLLHLPSRAFSSSIPHPRPLPTGKLPVLTHGAHGARQAHGEGRVGVGQARLTPFPGAQQRTTHPTHPPTNQPTNSTHLCRRTSSSCTRSCATHSTGGASMRRTRCKRSSSSYPSSRCVWVGVSCVRGAQI